jgi:hypothetical protein
MFEDEKQKNLCANHKEARWIANLQLAICFHLALSHFQHIPKLKEFFIYFYLFLFILGDFFSFFDQTSGECFWRIFVL